jgi:DNA repair exonuclease SbcCD ATPase subunit
LLQEIQTVTELDQYEKAALEKSEPLNKDDREDKQRAQLKQQAKGELQPEAEKLVQESNNLKKLLGNLDELIQRGTEIEVQENNYKELKTKLDNYKNLLKIDESSPERSGITGKLKRKEPRDTFRLVETMADYEKHYPEDVQQAIDAAQESLTQLNKETSRYGDGSVGYAAIAEQVNGSKIAGKFDAAAVALPGLGNLAHVVKCQQFITALQRSIRELEGYVGTHLTQRAIDILSREKGKLEQAAQWVNDYRAGNYPELPSWAESHREQLRQFGLKEMGETFSL